MRQVSGEEVKVKRSASAAQMWQRRVFIFGGACVVVALMVLYDSEQQQWGKVCTVFTVSS